MGKVGSTVTITGSGFSQTPSNNIVYFGSVRASVISASANQINVQVPMGVTPLPISVTVNNLTGYSTHPFIQTFESCGVPNLATAFPAHQDFPVSNSPWELIVVDINNDGKNDVITSFINGGGTDILINRSTPGNINFSPPFSLPNGRTVYYGDFDGDGRIDLVNGTTSGIAVFRNTSTINAVSFANPIYYPINLGPFNIKVADFNLDGKPDIVAGSNITPAHNLPGFISVYKNTSSPGSISFSAAQDFPTNGINANQLSTQDIDGDGKPEVIASNYWSYTLAILKNTSTVNNISFDQAILFPTGSYHPTNIVCRDFDDDGKSEVAITCYTPSFSKIMYWKNLSTPGNISMSPPTDYPVLQSGRGLFAGDLDADGKQELITANFISANVSLLKNISTPGNINFATYIHSNTGSFPQSPFVGDIDGDTRPDIVTPNHTDNTIAVLRNKEPIPPIINIQTTPSTCNSNNGTITVSATNDLPPYTYSIDGINFVNTNIFQNLSAGSYTITVKDASGCSSSMNATVLSPGTMQLAANISSPICSNLSSVTVNVTNGTTPFSYSLDGTNFQASNSFNNLQPGSYTITVKDGSGCISTIPINIHPYPFDFDATAIQPTCNNSDGSISLSATGNNPPFAYSLNGAPFGSTSLFNQLSPGVYSIHAKDANGCILDTSITLTNGCLDINTSVQNSSCGINNGIISVTALNGIPPYLYSLDGINYQPSNVFAGLQAGNYTIRVKDNAGTTRSVSVIVADVPGASLITTVSSTNCENNNGSIVLSPSGGTSPFLFSINGQNFQSNPAFSNLPAGIHMVSVKDANGCITNKSDTVLTDNNLYINAPDSFTICEGEKLQPGIQTNASSFIWTPGLYISAADQLNPEITGVSDISYVLTASSGVCEIKDTIDLKVLTAPVAYAGIDTSICLGQNLSISGVGGNEYLWSPSVYLSSSTVSNPTIVNPNEGKHVYTLTVIDSNGCKSLIPDSIFVTVKSVSVFAGRDTAIAMNQPIQLMAISVNNLDFDQYNWLPVTGLSNPNIADPVASIDRDIKYTVTVKTSEGCLGSDDILIKVYKGPTIYVPNAFTPNRDGLNDILKAIPVGLKSFKFTVFNRWGEMVFQTSDAMIGWDGNYKGKILPGVFIWIAEGVDFRNNSIKTKGSVILIK